MTETLSGATVVFHLAAINGTENFYSHPDLVLDVGIRGMLRGACFIAFSAGFSRCFLGGGLSNTSCNPDRRRCCAMSARSQIQDTYGGSKIISELIAFNYGKNHFRKVQVFRPHNVYGPDMGWKHAVPQLITQAIDLNVRKRMQRDFQNTGVWNRNKSICIHR